MSGSETGGAVMTTREPFTVASHSQPVMQNIRLAYGTDGAAVFKPIGSSPPPQSAASGGGGTGEGQATGGLMPHNLNVNLGENVKKKRGRPRKYGPDGTMALALMPTPATAAVAQAAGTFSPPSHPTPTSGGPVSPSSLKKGRGRPPGSSKKQQMEALGSAGVGFTPHIINVKAGEDVSSKIMSFSQHGPRAVCVLSANGAISNVTLRQAATSGGTATYEGRFEILSLSGSFLLTEVGGQRSRTGGLSVSLAGPDGRVLGGCVAGLLTAASPVQVIVGSFIADGRKESKPVKHMEPLSAPPKIASGVGATGASSPPSRGTLSESSGGPGSPLNHSTGACNSNPQGMLSMPWR
ncbi:AT-hook motif nuclear-localized protein [Actinidia chinensis var. chinensis]|uniref:AT-hook motif nuclear-localized protein n=1 Tax=Actinidia chinensis var. chinensis TaxID=1590841 RepID=A0A2R6PZ98_ACTCC|nr:AT-hook motif nuclear-localized protein [Actinidia chinensis var. chinensis]